MAILISCENCGQQYYVPRSAVGKRKTCDICKESFFARDPNGPPGFERIPATSSADYVTLNPIPDDSPRKRLQGIMIGAAATFLLTTLPLLCVLGYWYSMSANPDTYEDPTGVAWTDGKRYRWIPRETAPSEEIYNKVAESIVLIYGVRNGQSVGRGSGFVLAPGDRLISNCHVVEDVDFVVVETYWGQRVIVSKAYVLDERRDLAILPLPAKLTDHGLSLSERTHAIGQPVYIVGSPEDSFFSISKGVISQFSEHKKAREIETDSRAAPGASGSPLLDERGRVIGIVARGIEAKNQTFAVHQQELETLLKEYANAPLKKLADW